MCSNFSLVIIDTSNLHLSLKQTGPYIKKLNEQVMGKYEDEVAT